MEERQTFAVNREETKDSVLKWLTKLQDSIEEKILGKDYIANYVDEREEMREVFVLILPESSDYGLQKHNI